MLVDTVASENGHDRSLTRVLSMFELFAALPQSAHNLGTSLVYGQHLAIDFAAIEFGHRTAPFDVATHFHERKPSRLTRDTILCDCDIINYAVPLEH